MFTNSMENNRFRELDTTKSVKFYCINLEKYVITLKPVGNYKKCLPTITFVDLHVFLTLLMEKKTEKF